MKCCASPTTSTVPDPARAVAARDAAAKFEGLLLGKALAPVAKAIGFFGDVAVAAVCEKLAQSTSGSLTDALAKRALEERS